MNNEKSPRFSAIDYLKITVFGFALTALWSSLHSIILPLRLLDFVAESEKNTYLGMLTFSGLVLAMIVQPIAGAISDRSRSAWGPRRPYILLGAVFIILLMPGVGLFDSYIAIFATYCLLQIASNTAQGPYQGFIPDLVPEGKKGSASGVKGLLEVLGGSALVRLTGEFMGLYSTGQEKIWLWLSLGVLASVVLITVIVTMLTVKERPLHESIKLPSLSNVYRSFRIDIRQHSDFVFFLVSRLLFLMAFTTLQTFALYFLSDMIGVTNPAEATANLLIVIGISMVVAVYPAGRLSDKIGRKPMVMFAGLLGAVGIGLLLFARSYTEVIVYSSFLGFANGIFLSTNWALAIDLIPRAEVARYLGLTNLAAAGGAALARLIGPVMDFFNDYSPGLGYKVMLFACLLYFLVGALILLKVRQPLQPK